MSTPTKKRKPRQGAAIWTDASMKKAFEAQKRALGREAKKAEEKALADARAEIDARARRESHKVNNKGSAAVIKGLGSRIEAVKASWGLSHIPVRWEDARYTNSVGGSTNFTRIDIEYPGARLGKALDEMDTDTVSDIVLALRGVAYHEVGHNLFTVPLRVLGKAATGETDFCLWGLPTDLYYSEVQRAWNALEDQRMETLLVQASPALRPYLTILVAKELLRKGSFTPSPMPLSWYLLAGREYLPTSLRDASKAAWGHQSIVSADDLAAAVDAYKYADNAKDAFAAVVAFALLTKELNPPDKSGHSGGMDTGRGDFYYREGLSERAEREAEQSDRITKVPARPQDEDKDEDKDESTDAEGAGSDGTPKDDSKDEDESTGSGSDESKDAKGDDAQADGGAPADGESEGDQADDGDVPSTSVAGTHSNPRTWDEEVNEVLRDATKDAASTDTHAGDIQAVNESFNSEEGTLAPSKVDGVVRDEDLVSKAADIVREIEDAFSIATANCAPVWESGQRRGALEPIRYRTRTPGDLELFRAYNDSGDPGSDVRVTILLDMSGSMANDMAALGAAAWASKTACANIGVDCEVIMFDTNAYGLYALDDPAPDFVPLVPAIGGTNPTMALDAMASNETEHGTHIVLIMTDGVWSGAHDLSKWRTDSTFISVLVYSEGYEGDGEVMYYGYRNSFRGHDEARMIGDLAAIPQAIEGLLLVAVGE